MNEWTDITISCRDKKLSEEPMAGDTELRRQAFLLSAEPSPEWSKLCNEVLNASPGRSGRQAEVQGSVLYVWGGANVFDKRDAENLETVVDYVNGKMKERLQPADHSGFDAFD